MTILANAHIQLGELAEAEELYNYIIPTSRRVLSAEHPETLIAMNNFGMLYMEQGKYDAAEALLTEALEIRTRVIGDKPLTPALCIASFRSGLLRKAWALSSDSKPATTAIVFGSSTERLTRANTA